MKLLASYTAFFFLSYFGGKTSAFTTNYGHQKNVGITKLIDNKNSIKKPCFIPKSATTTDISLDAMKEDVNVDPLITKEEEEMALVMGFIEVVQTTSPGELDVDEIDLLREICASFPGDIDGVEAAEIVKLLLLRQIAEWKAALDAGDNEKEKAFRPCTQDFHNALSRWEKSDNPDKIIHALALLSDQRELYTSGVEEAKPDLEIINCVLRILLEAGDRGISKRATQVFNSLKDFNLEPNQETYSLIIPMVARGPERAAPVRAEEMLYKALKEFPPRMVNGARTGISSDVCNTVVTAYAKSGYDDGPEKAEMVIVQMDTVDAENGCLGVCSPNVKTFTSLIDAYTQQNDWESISQADRVLNRLLDEYLGGNDDLEPSIATWTIVMAAWARLSKNNRHGAATRAGRLLKRMEDLYRDGKISFRPDAIAYATSLNAYAFSKNGEGAEEAEEILREMNEMYLDGDDNMKPRPRSVKNCIEAWIKAGDMERAESLLDDFEDFFDDDGESESGSKDLREIYRSLLFGYALADNPYSASSYLNSMVEDGLQPDIVCYDRVIDCNTRVDAVKNLKSSLQTFELLEKQRLKGEVMPNERVYTSFIRALTKGRASGLHKKASILLARMNKLYEEGNNNDIKPTVFTYNAVLNACAECIHLDSASWGEAFKTSVQVFTELRNNRKNVRPDHVTYGNMLRCSRLLSEEDETKEKFISATFKLCCDEGHVNTFVLRDLNLAASETLVQSLLGGQSGDVDINFLPYEWRQMAERKPKDDFRRERPPQNRRSNHKRNYRR